MQLNAGALKIDLQATDTSSAFGKTDLNTVTLDLHITRRVVGWILATGVWNDAGVWQDDAEWKDAA
jgi:hypothetical protein